MNIADKLKLIIAVPEGTKIITTQPETSTDNIIELLKKSGMNVFRVLCKQLGGNFLDVVDIPIPSQCDMVIYENFDTLPPYFNSIICYKELHNSSRKALFLISPDTVPDITWTIDPAFLSRSIQIY